MMASRHHEKPLLFLSKSTLNLSLTYIGLKDIFRDKAAVCPKSYEHTQQPL